MQEFYHKFYSQYLGRDFEMLVYGHAGLPVILFPAALGRYYQAKDFGLIASVNDFLESGKVKIYCPDTIDNESWFNYDIHPSERIQRQLTYENLILNEVIGFAKYETEFEKVALAGCDLGAYQAINNSLKHPEVVSHIISMGGTFDIKKFIFGYYDDDCYYNNPPDYLPGLTNEKFIDEINKINFFIGCGEFDDGIEENKNLVNLLTEKNIMYRFDILPNADHDWPWWRHMFYYFIKDLKY